jgi:hypothetical protein
MTLIVFAVPVIPLFPLKLIGLWLLAHEYWLAAIFTILFAKFARRRRHRLHLRCDARKAAGDALVRSGLRLHPDDARQGDRAGRADQGAHPRHPARRRRQAGRRGRCG